MNVYSRKKSGSKMNTSYPGCEKWKDFDRDIDDKFFDKIVKAIESWGKILKVAIKPKQPHSFDHKKELLFIVEFNSPMAMTKRRDDRFLELYHKSWLHIWDTPFYIHHLACENFRYDESVECIIQCEKSTKDIIVFELTGVNDTTGAFRMSVEDVMSSLVFVPDEHLQQLKEKTHYVRKDSSYIYSHSMKYRERHDKTEEYFLSKEGVEKLKGRYVKWIENSGKAMLEHGISMGRFTPIDMDYNKYLKMEETTRF